MVTARHHRTRGGIEFPEQSGFSQRIGLTEPTRRGGLKQQATLGFLRRPDVNHYSDSNPLDRPVSKRQRKDRNLFGSDPAPIMALGKKLGVRPLVWPLISAEHRSFVVLGAARSEPVREFVLQSGLIPWNSVEIIHVVTQEEALKEIASLTPIY
jgi:hypothetical protein